MQQPGLVVHVVVYGQGAPTGYRSQKVLIKIYIIEARLKVIDNKEVWDIVDVGNIPDGKKIVGCMWVFTNKFDAEENVVNQNAQLVAKGYTQVQGKDFDECMPQWFNWS